MFALNGRRTRLIRPLSLAVALTDSTIALLEPGGTGMPDVDVLPFHAKSLTETEGGLQGGR